MQQVAADKQYCIAVGIVVDIASVIDAGIDIGPFLTII